MYYLYISDRKFVPDGWKDREDALPVWVNNMIFLSIPVT
jgi:hypothetical protein